MYVASEASCGVTLVNDVAVPMTGCYDFVSGTSEHINREQPQFLESRGVLQRRPHQQIESFDERTAVS